MDKTFYHMQHDNVERKDLFQVMEAFSKVKDTDGKMVGPAFKTKKYDLHDDKKNDQPEGVFTQAPSGHTGSFVS
jgi:hypothetical protein